MLEKQSQQLKFIYLKPFLNPEINKWKLTLFYSKKPIKHDIV